MKKYVLKDLDCPVCAQKIEDHLKSLGYDATVSFVNKSLYIKEEISLELLNKEVRSVEDEVTVVEEKEEEKDNYVPLILSVLLLVAGLLIEKSGFSLVFFIFSYLLVGYKVIVKSIKNVLHGEIFDENFLQRRPDSVRRRKNAEMLGGEPPLASRNSFPPFMIYRAVKYRMRRN